MEYEVCIKNIFSRDAVLEQLKGGRGLLDFFGGASLDQRYLPGTNTTFSPAVLSRLHRVNLGRPPVHETADYALYYLSSLGGMEKDYYRIDSRTLLYDRHIRWAYWESPSEISATASHTQILNGPLDNLDTNSPFNKIRDGKPHGGTDYPVPKGTNYYATANGIVVRADFSITYGNVVIIDHGRSRTQTGKVYTVYAHCSKLLVGNKQSVRVKQVVGLTGNTGNVRPKNPGGYHGHYEVICTQAPFGSADFYAHKHKHPPTNLKKLLLGR